MPGFTAFMISASVLAASSSAIMKAASSMRQATMA